uniref:Protein ENL-like n=1 Tax=Nicotiana tabacum TaxID=4097 RepID=A0A1S3X0P3_TOBAC|nr:PREDICTED: protein ENL-like [Nicotiana tabacum]
MTNPQENPGTPPQPTPSDSSTPPPHSTSPKPRLRRVKMLGRKTIGSGAFRKKLNEKLKASQTQDSDSNSDSESYKSASEGEGPRSSDSEKDQESPSKVGASYDPKKQRTPTRKAHSVPKHSKKRKASSPTTRSRVKQSERDLQKALAEGKKKKLAKEKGRLQNPQRL